MFDETADISGREQMSIIIRHLNKQNKINESFLGFVDCYSELDDSNLSLTGINLGNIVIEFLKKNRYDLNKLVSIGTDAPNVMTSITVGAAATIKSI